VSQIEKILTKAYRTIGSEASTKKLKKKESQVNWTFDEFFKLKYFHILRLLLEWIESVECHHCAMTTLDDGKMIDQLFQMWCVRLQCDMDWLCELGT
jgi:hypothetical protein